jgi:NAD(P)-dependent dehydrogenase (short-subunit alcohol dehydrogenase family)
MSVHPALPNTSSERATNRTDVGVRHRVLMLSVGGLVGTPILSSNSATKGAVRLLAKSSAANGIRVNSVHPGITATGLWNKIGPLDANGRNTPTEPHELARTVALDVPAKPREIAAL